MKLKDIIIALLAGAGLSLTLLLGIILKEDPPPKEQQIIPPEEAQEFTAESWVLVWDALDQISDFCIESKSALDVDSLIIYGRGAETSYDEYEEHVQARAWIPGTEFMVTKTMRK